MDKKYIVKNCPSIYTGWKTMYKCFHYNNPCKDCTYCLIKQVIEKCKQIEIECPCEFQGFDCWECHINIQKRFAQQILQLFEIEEVNNDR